MNFIFGNALAGFLPGTDDIPLMDGLTLQHTNDFVFDSPAGQVLNLSGVTQSSVREVRLFYEKAMIELGWEKIDTDLYKRGKDILQFTITSNATETQVLFDVTLSDNETQN